MRTPTLRLWGDRREWILEESGWVDIQDLGQFFEHIDRGRMHLTLEMTDIGPVEARASGQFFLRHSSSVAHSPQISRHHRP